MGTGWLVAHVCGFNLRKNSLNSYKPARRKKKWNANTEGFFFPQKRWHRDKLKLGADSFEVLRFVHENISVVRRNGNQVRIFLTIPKINKNHVVVGLARRPLRMCTSRELFVPAKTRDTFIIILRNQRNRHADRSKNKKTLLIIKQNLIGTRLQVPFLGILGVNLFTQKSCSMTLPIWIFPVDIALQSASKWLMRNWSLV